MPSTGTVGTPMPAYAGGQVATGGQLGLLGNRSVMNTPFNQTSYTSKLIEDQQAKTVTDVLFNDPSVTMEGARGGGFDQFSIRGFGGLGGDRMTINNLPGMAGVLTPLELVERVEVLKGPATILNGMPPSNNLVGGSVNLVLKRATDDPITRLTAGYMSRSHFGTHLDVGRRYGDRKEFGVRFNGSYRDGDTSVDPNGIAIGLGGLGLDYRGERVRLAVDVGYQRSTISAPTPFTAIVQGSGPPFALPAPPDASRNYAPSWARRDIENQFAILQGEADLTDNVTAFAAFGVHDSNMQELSAVPFGIISSAGDARATPSSGSEKYQNMSGQAGIRTQFNTGFVHHRLSVDASRATKDYSYRSNSLGLGGAFLSNIYAPADIARPNIISPTPVKLSDIALTSVGIADTLSMLDERVQLTTGVRRQQVESTGYNAAGATTSSYDQHAWTPFYALVVKPLANVSVYANYIEGLEQGFTVGPNYTNTGQTFGPYPAHQYEGGVKVDWGTVTTAISAFQITRQNAFDIAGLPPTRAVDGEQVNRGVELNAFGEPIKGFRVLGGVMFLDGRQTRTQGGINDGKKAFGVPDANVALGAEWDTPFLRGFTVTGRVNHSTWTFNDAANTQTVPAWTRVDLGARYTFLSPWNGKSITLRFDVQNVFDRNYWVQRTDSSLVYLAPPRTFLASTTFNF